MTRAATASFPTPDLSMRTSRPTSPFIGLPASLGVGFSSRRRLRARRLGRVLSFKHFGHANKIREGCSVHLSHNGSALDFDGDFGSPEGGGNLLVKKALYDHGHDFSLART